MTRNCPTCKHSDSWGIPDCVMPSECGEAKDHWVPLNPKIPDKKRELMAEVERFAAIEHALCVIGKALCASHGCVATDLPDVMVTDTSWHIDHMPEMAQLAVLKAAFDAAMQAETNVMKMYPRSMMRGDFN